jgi:transcription elongation GreA/GreB family factor
VLFWNNAFENRHADGLAAFPRSAYLPLMSSAFTKDSDDGGALPEPGERHVSAHRNLVTRHGLELIDAEIAALRQEHHRAETEGDREKLALTSRDLRYWTARRENAEISEPEPGSDAIRFGMSVAVRGEDGKEHSWKIVGEDEADAKHGTVSHVSPMALALFGKRTGEAASVNGREWEIVSVSAGKA